MGSYLRPIDFVYHSTLCLRVIDKKKTVPTTLSRKIDHHANKKTFEVEWCWVGGPDRLVFVIEVDVVES